MMPGFQRAFDYLPNTTDWYGRWRLAAEPENDWLIDREAQTTRRQLHRHRRHPRAGPGGDREHGAGHRPLFEHLAPSDRMIMATRRRLLRAARALAKDGTVPPGVDEPGDHVPGAQRRFRRRRAARLARRLRPQMRAAVRPLKMAAE